MTEHRGGGSSLKSPQGEERRKRRRGRTGGSPSRALRGVTLRRIWIVAGCSRRVAFDNLNFSEFADVPSNVLERTTHKSQNYADRRSKHHSRVQDTTLTPGDCRQCASPMSVSATVRVAAFLAYRVPLSLTPDLHVGALYRSLSNLSMKLTTRSHTNHGF